MLPGAPTPMAAIAGLPAASTASTTSLWIASTTAGGPPVDGVGDRLSPSRSKAESVTTTWILVPPTSTPTRPGAARPDGVVRRDRGAAGVVAISEWAEPG